MADYKAQTLEQSAAAITLPARGEHAAGAPFFMVDAECVGPEGVRWRDGYHNVVVNQGKQHIINRLFGSKTANTAGVFLHLHSATTASNHAWSDISASRVVSYGDNVPLLTFASSYTDNSASASCSYGFTAGTQTVSGGAVVFYTTNTMSTNAATADMLEYSEGHFAASRQIVSGDTLNVTVTVSYA